MRIIRFTAENFKRLKAVEITPDGSMVIIGGKNEQGKTSTLDGIQATLGGKRAVPREPIRRGEQQAFTGLELGEGDEPQIRVTREFTADGGTRLIAKRLDGGTLKQDDLSSLVCDLSFDPLEFSRMKPGDQKALLMRLAKLDFAKQDEARATAYDDRRAVGREVRALEGQLQGLPLHEDAPGAEVSVADLSEQLDRINAAQRDQSESERELHEAKRRVLNTESEIEDLEARLAKARESLVGLRGDLDEKQKAHDALPAIADPEPIREQIRSAEATNAKVRDNAKRDEVASQLKAKQAEYDKFTATIDDIDREKQKAIESAQFPIDGLSVDDEGVTFNGLPFEQASHAARLKVSVAIGMALNPKLKILLIRDGNALDAANLRMVAEMAEKAGGEVWLERVSDTGEGCTVVIEDGQVKSAVEAGEAAE